MSLHASRCGPPETRKPAPTSRARLRAASVASVMVLFAVSGPSPMSRAFAQEQEITESSPRSPDESFIVVNGTVESLSPHGFVLDFGDGEIPIEMNVAAWVDDEPSMRANDEVIVYGVIEEGATGRVLEAGAVHVKRLDRTLYPGNTEEDAARRYDLLELSESPEPHEIVVKGTVASIDDEAEELVLAVGESRIEVEFDAASLVTLPEPDVLEIGDVITVSGRIDEGFMQDSVMVAEVVQQPEGNGRLE